jgi:hypothetical protein
MCRTAGSESGRVEDPALHGELIQDGVDRPGTLSFLPAGVERSGFYQDADHNRWHAR